jgi:hypothetical protein
MYLMFICVAGSTIATLEFLVAKIMELEEITNRRTLLILKLMCGNKFI